MVNYVILVPEDNIQRIADVYLSSSLQSQDGGYQLFKEQHMTFIQYVNAVLASDDLEAPSALLAVAIASHYNWKSMTDCFAGNALLAKESKMTVRSVTKHKQKLSDAGFISILHRFNTSSLIKCTLPQEHSSRGM